MDSAAILQSIDQICISNPALSSEITELRTQVQLLISENKQLREERDKFRSYVENANDTIAIFDLEGRVTYSTENWGRQLGYEVQNIMNQRVFERFMHPDDVQKSQDFFDAAVKSKKSQFGIEYRIRHSDGSWRWHMTNLAPILNEDSEVEALVAIARCTHRTKVAELQMRDSEARLRLILDTMREGVILVDNHERIQYVNQSTCDIFSLAAEELLGKVGFELLILPEDHPAIFSQNQERAAGVVSDYEVRGRKGDSELIWLHVSAAPLLDDEANVLGSLAIITDITQKRAMLQTLRHSEEKHRHLFEDSIAGVFQSSFDDRYLTVNPAFAKMFGYQDPQQMIEQVTDISHLYARPKQREHLKQRLLQDGFIENFEIELKRKDGHPFWVMLFAKLRCDQEGRMILEGTCIDITESRSLRDQLLASQKMDAIGKIAGGVAHDFNNLLTVILGYAEDIIEDLSPDSRHFEPAEEIMKAGLRAANLTRQLLAFSRKQIIHNEEIDFNSLVNNLRSIIDRIVGTEIKVDFQLSDDLPCVKADPNQIEQVIINIVINAKEAMPTGGKLSIKSSTMLVDSSFGKLYPELKDGNYVMLSFTDTGLGMDTATLKQIFDPFFTNKNNLNSVGLGLASAYGIISQAHGIIIPYSEIGQGSTMQILLPALSGSIQPDSSSQMPATLRGKGQKILVVEDEDALRRMVHKMLYNMGYYVDSTSSAASALQRFVDKEAYDLVLSDVVMPNMNGKKLADAILKIKPSQKILFMSGFMNDAISQHDILDKGLPFIQKPFSAKAIATVIQTLLRKSEEQLSLLIFDSEAGICKLFQKSCLKRGHHCDTAAQLSEALHLAALHHYDILLIDFNLDQTSGIEAIQKLRQKGCNVPIIVRSGLISSRVHDQLKGLGVVQTFETNYDHSLILGFIENYAIEHRPR